MRNQLIEGVLVPLGKPEPFVICCMLVLVCGE
jgi:hypothetical protein